MHRRQFLTAAGTAMAAAVASSTRTLNGQSRGARANARFRTGLVAYSYREALQAKTMTYEDLIRVAVTPASTAST